MDKGKQYAPTTLWRGQKKYLYQNPLNPYKEVPSIPKMNRYTCDIRAC